MQQTMTLAELAQQLNAKLVGDGACTINGVASLASAQAGQVCFAEGPKQLNELKNTRASAVILPESLAEQCPTACLIVAKPRLQFIVAVNIFNPPRKFKPGVHATAIIGESCVVDASATIGPYVVIEDHVKIGANAIIEAGAQIGSHVQIGAQSHIYPRVVLYPNTQIGERTIIHSGAVIGADGFGFEPNEKGHWQKVPQIGKVVIGNDVEIGANACIDCGALDDTIIGNGVKMDDLTMLGHNVQLGDHTIMAGCAGVAGSTKVGKNCIIAGGVCVKDHIEIADRVIITGMAMVHKSLEEPGIYSSGTGILTNRDWHRSMIRFGQLDEMAKRIKKIEEQLVGDEHVESE